MATPPPPQQAPGPHGPAGGPVFTGPQQPYGAYGTHPQPGRYGCSLCGAWPAAPATVRGHQGMVVLARFLSRRGPFCRDCGLATYRGMSSDTLWQGWWSPLSLFVTPVTLLMNLGPRAAFRRLAPPSGGFRPPLDPGKPLWRRPPALLVLAPIALVALAIPTLVVLGLLAGDDEPTRLSVGQCVRDVAKGSGQTLLVEPCNSPDAEYRVTRHLGPGTTCADGELYAYPEYGPGGTTTSCLAPLR
ncbi:hypothetical protein ACFWFZ_23250 [Streptomyces sp. NPDC060232]|uniref:LppU/SCO3897 family protein n=1 Tax=Streptomyces sp. NPDC060232 TaxID=3347079 RepID=UPI0036672471